MLRRMLTTFTDLLWERAKRGEEFEQQWLQQQTGLDQGTISKLFAAKPSKKRPDSTAFVTVVKVAKALNVSVDALISDPPPLVALKR